MSVFSIKNTQRYKSLVEFAIYFDASLYARY